MNGLADLRAVSLAAGVETIAGGRSLVLARPAARAILGYVVENARRQKDIFDITKGGDRTTGNARSQLFGLVSVHLSHPGGKPCLAYIV